MSNPRESHAGAARGLAVWVLGVLLLVLPAVGGRDCSAEQLGDVTVTLRSHKYYKQGNYTRFVYQTTASTTMPPSLWILGVGPCVTDEVVVQDATTPYAWTTSPITGMSFLPTTRNDKFYIFLHGRWDLATLDVAVVDGEGIWTTGRIDGPSCGVSSLSLEVVEGESVAFPEITGDGTYAGMPPTTLRVTSSTADWVLSHTLRLSVPDGASESTVERMFRLQIAPFEARAGITTMDVRCFLDVTVGDFVHLPQGNYIIDVVYTVAAD